MIKLDRQPLFGKGARAPPPKFFSRKEANLQTKKAAEIEPTKWSAPGQSVKALKSQNDRQSDIFLKF